ncbi:MAG: bifunctional DNA-formamidopyrimidine glycosylase/DNA-(apurinic or apyrimidinic site) lyase [Desulfobulbaceae bacterium]|nr:bifunctional DNA-formamidopyrimidine glycosylase/DNA-(apurinic or apyrimidinic site) lyase [Desulfobulbaceae bacterium]
MPELPEVEVIRQGLAPLVVGRQVVRVGCSGKKLRLPVPVAALQARLPGCRIVAVERRAKYLLLRTDREDLLIIHLGMTGRLGLFAVDVPQARHDHLCFLLDNGLEMRFNDARRFGSVQFFAAAQMRKDDPFAGLGPEPLGKGFTAAYMQKRAVGRRLPVKGFLMENRVVVGIGNIYASETLFAARIDPLRPAGVLSLEQWRAITRSARKVLRRAIAAGGSTISDYVNAGGESGYFQLELAVYGRDGQPCRSCRATIKRVMVGGRATFFCPGCQG